MFFHSLENAGKYLLLLITPNLVFVRGVRIIFFKLLLNIFILQNFYNIFLFFFILCLNIKMLGSIKGLLCRLRMHNTHLIVVERLCFIFMLKQIPLQIY